MKDCAAALACSVAALGAVAVSPVLAAPQGTSDAPAHVHRVFDVLRQGSKIGNETYDVTHKGDMTSVKVTSHVLVKIAFITAYRYDRTETETWKGSQLVAFKSTTDDNGKAHEISASQAGGKITLTVDGEAAPVSKGIAPASIWGLEIAKHSQLFDPGTGKRMSARAEDLGDETMEMHGAPRQLKHLKLSGQFERELWFDEQGLVKMSMIGSDNSTITSELRQSTASR